jgi:hypothetical protein
MLIPFLLLFPNLIESPEPQQPLSKGRLYPPSKMRITNYLSGLRLATISLALLLGGIFAMEAHAAPAGPAGAVVLIVRHAEKPETGTGLTEDGTKRANAYVKYFQDLKLDGKSATPNHLFATRDSDNSQRPRLTLEPLSAAFHLPLRAEIKNKDFEVLANSLKGAKYRGQTILIAWHHGHIPDLLRALGADPVRLLPEGKWPENVFGWMVVLRYDHEGKLKESQVMNENLLPSDASNLPPGGK